MDDVICPFCRTGNGADATACSNCNRSLIVGKLTCMGTGVLPQGFVLEMRPRDLTIGRQIANDFVIPSNMIAGKQLRLRYSPSGFTVTDLEGHGRCSLDGEPIIEPTPMRNHCTLRIAIEEFQFESCQPGVERSKKSDPLAAHLQLTLGIISEFHSSLNMKEVFSNALDAVLRITHTSRAYAFMVEENSEGEMELQEIAARASGGKPLPEEEEGYTISQSIIERVLAGDNSVIIEDAGAEQVNTETIRRFKLKSLVCLPLLKYDPQTRQKQVMGIIYADSLMPTGQLPPYCQPTLQMLTQIVSATIVKWQGYSHMQQLASQCSRSAQALDGDLEICSTQVQGLLEQLEATKSVSQTLRDEMIFDLEAVSSRLETVRANLKRLKKTN